MPRLRRTFPDQPGWTRRRSGSGFTYLDEHGDRPRRGPGRSAARTSSSRRRGRTCGSRRTPTATCRPSAPTTPVGASTSTTRSGAPAATRRSSTGSWCSARRCPRPASGCSPTSAREGMSLERACAVAVRLLDLGYFRIGNDVYTDANGSLRADHDRAPGARRAAPGRAGLRLHRQVRGRARHRDRRPVRDRGARRDAPPARRRRRLLAWKDGRRWGTLVLPTGQRLHPRAASASRPRPRTSAPGTPRCSPRPRWPRPTSRGRRRPRASARSPAR